jgi:hypothetical protein
VVDWSDSQTLWLNLMNAALGGITVVALVAMACAVWLDIRSKIRSKNP